MKFKNTTLLFSLIKNIFFISIPLLLGKKLVLINLEEHIGDIVACEPVSRRIRSEEPNAYVIWITKYSNTVLVRHNPAIDRILGVTCLYEWMLLKKMKFPARVVDLHIDGRICTVFGKELENKNSTGVTLENYYSHGTLLESFSMAAGLSARDAAPVFHFQKNIQKDLPAGLIVFHCASNEPCRNWTDGHWNHLARLLIQTGHRVAEVGRDPKVRLVHDDFYDYCGKLSLQEIALLIQRARLFIGIDSAFAHFANAVETPGVILLGKYRDFKKYMPYSGNYKNGSNAEILQQEGDAKNIPVRRVLEAAFKRLDGQPAVTNTPFWEHNEEFNVLFTQTQERSVVTADRCFMVWQLAKSAANLEGDAAEVGVYRGGTAKIIAKSGPQRIVRLFDTFSGMPRTNAEWDIHERGDFSDSSLEETRGFLSDCGNVEFYAGLFPISAAALGGTRYNFVHIDVDIYESAKNALRFFYDKMVAGGILLFDDYEWVACPGVKKAIDEFMTDKKEKPVVTADYQCMIIKL